MDIYGLIYRWQTVYQTWIEILIALLAGFGVLWQIYTEKEKIESEKTAKLKGIKPQALFSLVNIREVLDLDREACLRTYNNFNYLIENNILIGQEKNDIMRNSISLELMKSLFDILPVSDIDARKKVNAFCNIVQAYSYWTGYIQKKPFVRLDELWPIIFYNAALIDISESLFPYLRDKDEKITISIDKNKVESYIKNNYPPEIVEQMDKFRPDSADNYISAIKTFL
ncbi:hypothetical protein A0U94_14760 (plasmid) [Gluconobacter albidus]|uniref:hypothetical protein n=1 Tax=Gluconobacter albidus TaxID=318683 RepID=UPI00098B595E|nr:hypothetical protein [Gluconobacter albidus]AQS92426.1 hypothetical protein A0U94_14760 [Gluconobacter albidus]